MATTVGRLAVILSANTAGFSAGLKRAHGSVSSFTSSITSSTRMIVGWGSALLAVAAGGGLVMLVKREMEAIDVTAKLADRMGIAVESLVGLQHAADIAGVGAESINTALKFMNKNLGEAAHGGGDAAKWLERMGLNAAQLASMNPAEAMGKIADAFKNINSPAERAAAAMKIFGRSGVDILNVLDLGSAGLAKMQEEAERLGLTFSRLDAAKVEEANDAITRMQGAFTGLVRIAAIELAPILEALADEIVEMATASDDLGARMSAGFEGIGAEIATVIDLVNLLTAAWKGLKGFMLFFGATVVKVFSLIGSAIQGVLNLIPGMEVEFADTMHRMADEMMQMSADAFGESGKAFGTFWSDENSNKVEKFFDDMKAKSAEAAASMALDSFFRGVESGPMVDLEAADAIDKIDASLESFFDFADEIAREAADMARTAAENLEQEVASIFDATRSPMEQYEARITRLNELLQLGPENGGLAWDTYGRAVRKAREELEATANFEVKSPAALERGSVAEFSARQQIIRDNQSDALKREFMKGLDEEKKQTSFLKQIESNLRQTDAVVTVSIP